MKLSSIAVLGAIALSLPGSRAGSLDSECGVDASGEDEICNVKQCIETTNLAAKKECAGEIGKSDTLNKNKIVPHATNQ